MDDAFAALAAKQEITEAIYRYCRAMDRIDRTLGHTVWHAGGTCDYGALFKGTTGAEFIEWVSDVHQAMAATSHQISNILIELDGERATSEAYVTATLRMQVDGVLADRIVLGRYLDRWSRRDGRWAIDHRRYVHDLDHILPPPAATTAAREATNAGG